MAERPVTLLIEALAQQAAALDPESLPWLRRHGFSVWSAAERGIDTLPAADLDEVIHVPVYNRGEPHAIRLRAYLWRNGMSYVVLTDPAHALDGDGDVPLTLHESDNLGLAFYVALVRIGPMYPVRFLIHEPGSLGDVMPDMVEACENLREVVFPGQAEGEIDLAPHCDSGHQGFDFPVDGHPVSILEFRALIGDLPPNPFSLL